jgi:hypothetical protein
MKKRNGRNGCVYSALFIDSFLTEPPWPLSPLRRDQTRPGPFLSLASECDALLALFDALLQQAAMLAENPIPIIKDRFQRSLRRLTSTLSSTPSFAAIAFMWKDEIMTRGVHKFV